MSDQHDPFADRPYSPPRPDDAGPTPDATPGPADDAGSHETGAEDATVERRTAAQPAITRTGQDDAAPADEPAPDYSHRYAAAGVGGAAGAAGGSAGHGEETVVIPAEQQGGVTTAGAPKRRRGRTVAGVAALALLAAGAGAGGAWVYDEVGEDSGTSPVVSSLDSSGESTQAATGQIGQVAQAVLPSVVQINVAGGQEAGSGTGIVISSDGNILTNNHVVEAAAEQGTITVAFSDATTSQATIVGRDPKTDLAVIKVERDGLTPATLGSSADLAVGQEVVAIGSPFGLESTVTSGIVSALNRPVSSSDGTGQNPTVFPAVQTDAAINPGNSGGPLVDLEGRVVGINSAIRSGGATAASAGSIGLGFAIPVDLAKSVAEQLVNGETVEHALIGVTVRPATGDDEITGIGAEIREVNDGSAGAEAGLRVGDIVTAINDQPVSSSDALVAGIRGYSPGETVTLTFLRDGERQQTEVTLDSDGGATN